MTASVFCAVTQTFNTTLFCTFQFFEIRSKKVTPEGKWDTKWRIAYVILLFTQQIGHDT